MKFISKNLNLRIVLSPSIPSAPLAGQVGKSGIYAKFENGLLSTDDPNIINQLLSHPAYNLDFSSVSQEDEAYIHNREYSNEPEHDVTEIQYGHVGKSLNPKAPIQMSPEVRAFLAETAAKMAADMVKNMMSSMPQNQPVGRIESDPKPVTPTSSDIALETTIPTVIAQIEPVETSTEKTKGKK